MFALQYYLGLDLELYFSQVDSNFGSSWLGLQLEYHKILLQFSNKKVKLDPTLLFNGIATDLYAGIGTSFSRFNCLIGDCKI